MRYKRLSIVVAGIASLCAAFLLLDFHAAASNTQAEKTVITTSMGAELPDTIQQRDKVSIAVVGAGPLVRALRKALAAEMDDAGIGECDLVQELEPVYQNPILVIRVDKPELIWTPFFATGRLSMEAGYASNGQTPAPGEMPLTIDNLSGPALNLSAEYIVTDRSWGLISRLGYHQILANYLAQQIVAALKDAYQA